MMTDSMTKSALNMYMSKVAIDLRPEGISVIMHCPVSIRQAIELAQHDTESVHMNCRDTSRYIQDSSVVCLSCESADRCFHNSQTDMNGGADGGAFSTRFREEAGLCLNTAALLGEISYLEGDGLGEMKSVSGMRTLGEGKERAGAVEVGNWFGVGRAWARA